MNRTSNNLRGWENTADFFSIAVIVDIWLNAYRTIRMSVANVLNYARGRTAIKN